MCNLRYYLYICLEELRETKKTSLKIAGLRVEIWTQILKNTKRNVKQLQLVNGVL
jgi:hypothetical protein